MLPRGDIPPAARRRSLLGLALSEQKILARDRFHFDTITFARGMASFLCVLRVSTNRCPHSQPAGKRVNPLNTDLLLKLEFPSNPELLCAVRGAMERLTERMGFSESECRSVTRAVDEAVTNIIHHAYRGQPNHPIVLTCYRLPKAVGSELAQGLEIVLEDQGEPPDPGRLRGRSLDEIKPGGLGLHYIRESMDVVEFSRSGGTNQLRLVRRLRPENTIQNS